MPTLNWIGKDKVINHHMDVPYRILEHSYGFSEGEQVQDETKSGNKIIHGDNLEALKSLLPEYEGKIDCICIDPPYNTGNEEWVYNDNVNAPRIKKWIGEIVGKEGDDLSRHDKWLCMIYPRLKLLGKLLSKNGSLVISIGYQEVTNLVLICKELFGHKQVVQVTVQTSGGKPSGGFNYQHEYLIFIVPKEFESNPLLYSGGNDRSPFEGLTLATFDKSQRPNQAYPIYIDTSNGSLVGTGPSLQDRIDSGTFKGPKDQFEYDFNEAPNGSVAVWPITSKGKECVWRLIAPRLKNDWDKGYIKISKNKSKNSLNKYSIQYLPIGVINKIQKGMLEVIGTEKQLPTLLFGKNKTVGGQIPTIWTEKEFYTVKGTGLINDIFLKKVFNYPKPLELIKEVLRGISSKDSLILDSFAGSGSTAHAILSLNKEDSGNRKFILIEMEDYAESITAERVKHVIKGYGEGNKAVNGTGGSFDYYELGKSLFLENELLNEEVELGKIREYVWFSETRQPYEKVGGEECHLLGKTNETAYYFYYYKKKITTLDDSFLRQIKTVANDYIIYADMCVIDEKLMQKYHITFKKIPRDITRF